jgi:hypothetical protein
MSLRSYRIMCHSENTLWELAEVDQDQIKPQAPTGASGGVEFEAMDYLVSMDLELHSRMNSIIEVAATF